MLKTTSFHDITVSQVAILFCIASSMEAGVRLIPRVSLK